jgi:starvation-inducible DNA-binding protein
MENTKIGLEKKVTLDIIDALNVLLADKHVLYIKTRNYHWNVKGDSFLELHEFFEKLYKEGEEHIDLIAERIRKLGHEVNGSMQDFLKQSQLNEASQPFNEPKKMIGQLLEDHETVIRWIRNHVSVAGDAEDFGTEDFLVSLLQAHEETAWMLRSYIG